MGGGDGGENGGREGEGGSGVNRDVDYYFNEYEGNMNWNSTSG